MRAELLDVVHVKLPTNPEFSMCWHKYQMPWYGVGLTLQKVTFLYSVASCSYLGATAFCERSNQRTGS